jgi:hypothetical protein
METTAAKIALSDKELELVCNSEWILTKHNIIQKVYQLFGDVLPELEKILLLNQNNLPDEVFVNAAKISKGENYHQLPYVILDYPRFFGKEDTVAIRTFFWWGNFFSISIQLSGSFLKAYIPLIESKWDQLQQDDYWFCVNESPWQHHFTEDNFMPMNRLTKEAFTRLLMQKPFIKMAKKIALDQWQDVPTFIVETFEEMAGLLKCN